MTEYDDEGRRIVEPEIMVDGRYRKAYSEEAFHDKLLRFAGILGKEGLRSAFILYYTTFRQRRGPSFWARSAISSFLPT